MIPNKTAQREQINRWVSVYSQGVYQFSELAMREMVQEDRKIAVSMWETRTAWNEMDETETRRLNPWFLSLVLRRCIKHVETHWVLRCVVLNKQSQNCPVQVAPDSKTKQNLWPPILTHLWQYKWCEDSWHTNHQKPGLQWMAWLAGHDRLPVDDEFNGKTPTKLQGTRVPWDISRNLHSLPHRSSHLTL